MFIKTTLHILTKKEGLEHTTKITNEYFALLYL